MITRRNFCAGLAGLIAAPYVIRNSGVLMPMRDRTITNGIVWAINPNPFLYIPLGGVYPFSGKAPTGWLPFDGRTITRDAHPALFSCTSLDRHKAVKLTMSGCVPALEAMTISNDGWWMSDAQMTVASNRIERL